MLHLSKTRHLPLLAATTAAKTLILRYAWYAQSVPNTARHENEWIGTNQQLMDAMESPLSFARAISGAADLRGLALSSLCAQFVDLVGSFYACE